MNEMRYGISAEFSADGDSWVIRDYSSALPDGSNYPGNIVWRREIKVGEFGADQYPPDLRAEYERLTGLPEFYAPPEGNHPNIFNLVELVEDGNFNQKCRFGKLVDGHAVYCHNNGWLYAPRKCRRTWYTGGEVRDEDCRGFAPNNRLPPEVTGQKPSAEE